MNFKNILMLVMLMAPMVNAAIVVNDEKPGSNPNSKASEEIHSVMSRANHSIDTLDVKAAEQEINKLKAMAQDPRYKDFARQIDGHVKNLEGALKFNMKHRHGELNLRTK